MSKKEEIKMLESRIKSLKRSEEFFKGSKCCGDTTRAIEILSDKLKSLKSKKDSAKKKNTPDSD